MALDIFKLAHADDFDLNTAALGQLRCWYPRIHKQKSALQGHPSDSPTEQVEFLRLVLLVSAHKSDKGDLFNENPLTKEEAEQVTPQELDEFADKQASRIFRRLGIEREHKETPYLVLLNAFREDEKIRRVELEKVREQYGHAFTKDSTIGAILKNIDASTALGATLSALNKRRVLAEEQPTIKVTPPLIPPNPVHETNSKLDNFLESVEEIKPVVIQTAEMLQSLNNAAREMQNDFIVASNKTEQQAKNATRLAAAGIFISAIGLVSSTFFSCQSMVDSQVSQNKAKADSEKASKETDEKVKLLQKELQSIRAAVENSPPKLVPEKLPKQTAAK